VQELKLNGYPEKFILQISSSRSFSNTNDEPEIKGLSCIPYMKGISEQVKQPLKSAGALLKIGVLNNTPWCVT
jgi:hypothetical protein